MKIIIRNRNGFRVEVKGHADYTERGKDIVCAGVSAIFYAFLNYAHRSKKLTDFQIKDGDSYVEAEVFDEVSRLVTIGLEGIAEEYPDYVTIEKAKE